MTNEFKHDKFKYSEYNRTHTKDQRIADASYLATRVINDYYPKLPDFVDADLFHTHMFKLIYWSIDDFSTEFVDNKWIVDLSNICDQILTCNWNFNHYENHELHYKKLSHGHWIQYYSCNKGRCMCRGRGDCGGGCSCAVEDKVAENEFI